MGNNRYAHSFGSEYSMCILIVFRTRPGLGRRLHIDSRGSEVELDFVSPEVFLRGAWVFWTASLRGLPIERGFNRRFGIIIARLRSEAITTKSKRDYEERKQL